MSLATALLSLAPSVFAQGELPSTTPATPSPVDTRFGQIGHPGPDPDEGDTPPVSVGVAANRIGKVTYAGARTDVPVSRRWSVIPQVALLHVEPFTPTARAVFVPYLGGGIGFRPAVGWSTEISALYGPMTQGIESVSAIAGVSKEIGADWANDVPPPVTLEFAVAYNRFRWENGQGPAGPTITQWFAQIQSMIRATRRLHVIPRAMGFVYDQSLEGATGPRVGSISVLSQVGTYAPRFALGGRVGYLIGERWFPFVDGMQIEYAAGVGRGTQVAGGLRFAFARQASVMAMGGVLWNDVGGPLVPTDYDLSRVPVIGTEFELGF